MERFPESFESQSWTQYSTRASAAEDGDRRPERGWRRARGRRQAERQRKAFRRRVRHHRRHADGMTPVARTGSRRLLGVLEPRGKDQLRADRRQARDHGTLQEARALPCILERDVVAAVISVKDRIALSMVRDAEKRGWIKPGVTTLVRATSQPFFGWRVCGVGGADERQHRSGTGLRCLRSGIRSGPDDAGHDEHGTARSAEGVRRQTCLDGRIAGEPAALGGSDRVWCLRE